MAIEIRKNLKKKNSSKPDLVSKKYIADNMKISYSQNKATLKGATDITWKTGDRPGKQELVDEFYRELNRGKR